LVLDIDEFVKSRI